MKRRALCHAMLWAPAVVPTTLMAQNSGGSLSPAAAMAAWAAIEARVGGRLGLAQWIDGEAAPLGHRLDERFPMCSSFKALLAAWALHQSAAGRVKMTERLRIERRELLAHSPVTSRHAGGPGLSLAQLCEATVTTSDNTAANLLLRRLGGPAGLTAFARSLGDATTRLDRFEPAMNTALDGDPRDTTTPASMAHSLRQLLLGDALPPAGRHTLRQWLQASRTGLDRLRAGLPPGWAVGDKTGTGENGSVVDVAVAWPPQGPARVITAYLHGSTAPTARLKAALADAARVAAQVRPATRV
jgi:beta-lactamase class A